MNKNNNILYTFLSWLLMVTWNLLSVLIFTNFLIDNNLELAIQLFTFFFFMVISNFALALVMVAIEMFIIGRKNGR